MVDAILVCVFYHIERAQSVAAAIKVHAGQVRTKYPTKRDFVVGAIGHLDAVQAVSYVQIPYLDVVGVDVDRVAPNMRVTKQSSVQ